MNSQRTMKTCIHFYLNRKEGVVAVRLQDMLKFSTVKAVLYGSFKGLKMN